jgi:AcrR family transcriptional regulator
VLTKRDKILETAKRLFTKNGFEGTPTSLIAQEAGVATGTLFHHFKSKDTLIHALYMAIYESIAARHEKSYNALAPLKEKIRILWMTDLDWGVSNVENSQFLERYSLHYHASEMTTEEVFRRFQFFIDIFDEGVASEQLDLPSAEKYAGSHFVWNVRMNIQYFINHPDFDTPKNREKSFAIYWKGIRRD